MLYQSKQKQKQNENINEQPKHNHYTNSFIGYYCRCNYFAQFRINSNFSILINNQKSIKMKKETFKTLAALLIISNLLLAFAIYSM